MDIYGANLPELQEDTKQYLDITQEYLDDLRNYVHNWMFSMKKIPFCFVGTTEERNNAISELNFRIRKDDNNADLLHGSPSQDGANRSLRTVQKFISVFQKRITDDVRKISDILEETMKRHDLEMELVPPGTEAFTRTEHHLDREPEVIIREKNADSPTPGPSKRRHPSDEEPVAKKILFGKNSAEGDNSPLLAINDKEVMDILGCNYTDSGERSSAGYEGKNRTVEKLEPTNLGSSPRKFWRTVVETETPYITECIRKADGILPFPELKKYLDEVKNKRIKELVATSQRYTHDLQPLLKQLYSLYKRILEEHQAYRKDINIQSRFLDKRLLDRIRNIIEVLQVHLNAKKTPDVLDDIPE